jgi:hypothetical protein
MLYNLVQKRRGKETVVMTDSLPKVNSRMKNLRSSQRKGIKGDRVAYSVEPTEENEKYKKKPHNYNIGGSDATYPPRVK